MAKLTLYTTHCPKCRILETKLNQKGVEYTLCEDVALMQSKGFTQAPMLGIVDESGAENVLDFSDAVKYVNAI